MLVGRSLRTCWYTTRAVECFPSLLRRVKHNLSLRSTSKLITPDKVRPVSRELTRRYLVFINFDYIRDNKKLKEMVRTLTFYFAAPREGKQVCNPKSVSEKSRKTNTGFI